MNQIDFLPEYYRLAEVRRVRIVREVLLLVVVALCIGGWYANTQRHIAEQERLAAAVHDEANADLSKNTEVLQLVSQKQTILRQTRVQRGLTEPVNISQVVATLAQIMPPSLAVSNLEIDDNRPTPSPAGSSSGEMPAPTPLRMELTGMAPTDLEIANFVGQLSNHPLFTNVKMDYSRAVQVGDLKAREFHLQFEVPLDRDYTPIHEGGRVAHAD